MKKLILFTLLTSLFFACSRPMANFTYSGKLKAPAKLEFENKSKNAESYEWNFGDGTVSQDISPSHQYFASGDYTISLKATKGSKSKIKQQQLSIEAPEECLIQIETPHGSMIVQLFDDTPKHQDNFVKLVEDGFYDDLLFHRVINNFMLQGGDPNSKDAQKNTQLGSGGPGYQIDAEFVDANVHTKGALAAARTNNPEKRSSGSQFYIVHGQEQSDSKLDQIEAKKGARYTKEQRDTYLEHGGTPFLDREYTVFGKVIAGLEVIDKIAGVQTNSQDRPEKDVWMKIRLIR